MGSYVLLNGGAHFLDPNNQLMGYSPKPVHCSDLYPLVCKVILGDVQKKVEVEDVLNVNGFLENNAHMQGVPQDVMWVYASPEAPCPSN